MRKNRLEKAYNFLEIEKKWQKIWRESNVFASGNFYEGQSFSIVIPPVDLGGSLDIGDYLTAAIPDVIIRRKKMQGVATFWVPAADDTGIAAQKASESSPGVDLPAAIHDRQEESKKQVTRRFSTLGLALDWDKMTFISRPEMSHVVSAVFVRLFNEGLIFRKGNWFLRASEIMKPAIEAVEAGEVTFIPEKWKKICLTRMPGIRDWPISSSSGRGCRVPAYYCGECDEVLVGESRPANCSRCGSSKIKDDREVAASWFVSALSPFLTSDRDKHSGNVAGFYPANIMAAGPDMIFSWVLKVIVLGIYIGKDIPFREVLVNAFVKFLPGAAHPLQIAGEYGADALRFAITARAVPGVDIAFSTDRIKGYKAFINKIWHASRFTIMNLKGDEDFDFDSSRITGADKWMLHYLNRTIEKINVQLDHYRVNKAADSLYRFFRHEFCDWYLEFLRKDIDKVDTRKVLKFILFKLIQLLHPFIPFITEEIFQKIKTDRDFLLQTEFPSFNSDLAFYDEFAGIELLKKVIKQIRKIRAENRFDADRSFRIYLKTESEKEKKILSGELEYLNFLTGSAGTEIVPDFKDLPKGFRGVCPNWDILLPFASEADRLDELDRLKKECAEIEDRAADFEKRLAAEELKNGTTQLEIAKLKRKLQETINKKEKIKKIIDDIS